MLLDIGLANIDIAIGDGGLYAITVLHTKWTNPLGPRGLTPGKFANVLRQEKLQTLTFDYFANFQ